jgi:Protein of unknown function (DUF3303)
MLFMVIERFKKGNAAAVGERFSARGRLLPDGVSYHASWMDLSGTRCFQLMEAAKRESLNDWSARWADLIDFEIVAVEASVEFWAKRRPI